MKFSAAKTFPIVSTVVRNIRLIVIAWLNFYIWPDYELMITLPVCLIMATNQWDSNSKGHNMYSLILILNFIVFHIQFTDTGGGNCLFTIGVTSNSYQNPMANNWVFTQSVDYLEAIEVIVNASVRFRGCQQRAVADPPCQKNYVTLHRYDTNTPTTVSERTDPNNYQPYLQNATTSRLELSTMDSGTIIMTYRRPQHFNFTHFGIQDTGTYGSVLRLLVYYKVAQGFEDGLVVCPSVALPPAGSGETNTRSCMCKANATPTANLVRTCNQNGVCQQSPAAAQCECNAGYEYNNVSKTCQGMI